MEAEGLDALVVTSSTVGKWFTGRFEPDEWHDQCQSRANFFLITADRDVLLMAPTVGGERLNTARRATWVSKIRAWSNSPARRDRSSGISSRSRAFSSRR